MKMIKILLFASIFAVFALEYISAAPKALALNPVFSEHMVLQRDVPLEIYGVSGPGRTVTVEIAGQKASTKADGYGRWSVMLKPITAGGPRELKVTSGSQAISLTDVLAGDVWFCSGQSNMEWPLWNTDDGAKELENFRAQNNIRLFLQKQVPSPKPRDEAEGSWAECTAENAKNFSAVAYFFAKNYRKEMQVPVGLIDSSWGGTSIEIWMKESAMKGNRITQPILDRWKKGGIFDWKRWKNGTGMDYSVTLSDVKFTSSSGKPELYVKLTPAAKVGIGGVWNAYANTGSSAVFRNGNLSGIIGFNSWANADTLLNDGRGYDLSDYDNIKFRAKGTGKYSIALGQESVKDYDYYMSPVYDAVEKGVEISLPFKELKQGGWGRPVSFTQDSVDRFKLNIMSQTVELPSALYNGMVSPFIKYKIKGVLWYQGENNAGRAKQYKTLLPMMITEWRKAWGYDFPFLDVQLTSFMERKNEPGESEWAELREAQLEALKLKDTAVISIIDLGDAKDIHPRYKEPVGARLANAALVMCFNKEGPATGPIYSSMSVEGSRIRIRFSDTGNKLEAKNGELKGFAIAGEDKKFVWAKAKIEGDMVIVWNDGIKEPKAVRYAWADNPECNLYNVAGLAASPFRTDDWPGLTDNNL